MRGLDYISWVESHPELWRNLQLLRYRKSRLIGQLVSPNHHLVLEGFPRSGNSFAVRVFLLLNGMRRTWSIAHHFHRLPQVTLGVRWNRPTIVLLRKPDDAVLSLMAHGIMKKVIPDSGEAAQLRLFGQAYDRWAFFYQHVLDLRDRVVISDFSTTIKRPDLVFASANQRFGTDFHARVPTVAEESMIFNTGGTHLSPDTDRDAIKVKLINLMRNPRLVVEREKASRLYDEVRSCAIVVE